MSRQYKPVEISPEAYQHDARLSPERALLAEVLMQAIRDIIDANVGKRCGAHHYKRLALLWLNDDNEQSDFGFTFVQCCDYLGLEAEQIRRIIRENIHLEKFQSSIGSNASKAAKIAWRRRVPKS